MNFFQLVLGCPLARPGAQEHCFEVPGGKRVPNDQTEKNLLGYIGNAEIPRTQVGVFGGCLGVVSGRLLFRSAQGPESLLYIYISNRDHDKDINTKNNDSAAFNTIIVLVLARILSFLLSLLL